MIFVYFLICVACVFLSLVLVFREETRLLEREGRNTYTVQPKAVIATRDLPIGAYGAAFERFVQYVEILKPDYILGIHTGGRLLSVLVGDRLGFDPDKIGFLHTRIERDTRIQFAEAETGATGKSSIPSGTVLLIDDIVRGGGTLNEATAFLREQTISGKLAITDLRTASLCVQSESNVRPDWWGIEVKSSMFQTPFTRLSNAILNAYRKHRRGEPLSRAEKDFIARHESIVLDYERSLAIAKSITSDIQFFQGDRNSRERQIIRLRQLLKLTHANGRVFRWRDQAKAAPA